MRDCAQPATTSRCRPRPGSASKRRPRIGAWSPASGGWPDADMAKFITRLTPFAGVLVFLAIWEIGVKLTKAPAYLLPAPSVIFHTFVAEFSKLAFHGWVTLYEMLLGYGLAVAVAIPLA